MNITTHTHTHTHTHSTTAGKKTWEYQAVTMHLETITEALQSNSCALQSLLLKLKVKGWLPVSSKPPEDDLVSSIIDRIKNDTSQFGEFIAMLDNIEGMDLVVDKLKSED